MRSTKIIKICSSSLCTCLHHMVILRTRNKITDFLMILAWASPFNVFLLIWLTGLADVVSTCSRQPKLLLLIITKDNNLMTCTICFTFYLDAGMQWVLGLYSCTISHQMSTIPLVNYRCEGWGAGGGSVACLEAPH